MKCYSHPGKYLSEHLNNVAEESKKKILLKKLDLRWSVEEIADFTDYIGRFHDFGKFTKYFQEYINEKDEKKKSILKNQPEVNHALISALFSYYCFKHVLGFDEDIAIISYFLIKKHHGNLTGISLGSEINIQHNLETLKKQIDNVDSDEVNNFYSFMDNFNLNKFKEFLNNPEIIYELDKSAYDIDDDELFILNNLLFSVLIDSDKKDAAGVFEFERLNIKPNTVDLYRQKTFDLSSNDSLNILRNKIYDKVVEINNLDSKKGIFSITAPTGTGKTLMSLSYALKLRDKMKNVLPRIIYCLPFTSIIDQNHKVIEDVLLKTIENYKKNSSRYLIKHHHLSNVDYMTENEKQPIENSLMYIESWNSEIIVSTFVQLFDTILGNRNRFLKKFHNIANSIIILDEVQNIPIKYWMLVNYVFNLLSKKLGCKIILLTATKPLIFEECKCEELLIKSEEDRKEYFEHEKLNRTKVEININEKLNIIEFFNKINIEKLMQKNNSIMFVFNTIQSSLDFYSLVKNTDVYVEYLSSNIIPKERKKRIENIKEMINNNKKIILITTQLVEAGVDLDFDTVFRDIGPIDSIIQVAGRCNRNGKKQQGQVFVYDLIDKNHKEYSNYVYQDLVLMSKQVLIRDVIEEKEFFVLIDDYFKLTKQKKSQDCSKQLIKKLKELIYYIRDKQTKGIESLADFKLINELPNLIDVFIEIDEKAATVWQQYSNLSLIKNRIGRKKEFLKIKNELREYIICINQNFLFDFDLMDKSILRIPKELIEQYYDDKTGFKREINESTGVFIN